MEPKAPSSYIGMMNAILGKPLTFPKLVDADLADSPDHLATPDATKYADEKYYPVENLSDRIEVGVDWGAISTMYKQLPIVDTESEMARHLARQLRKYQWVAQMESEEPDYQYECVDDFTIGDYFSVGCVYTGHCWVGDEEKLELLDDTGTARVVPAENFQRYVA